MSGIVERLESYLIPADARSAMKPAEITYLSGVLREAAGRIRALQGGAHGASAAELGQIRALAIAHAVPDVGETTYSLVRRVITQLQKDLDAAIFTPRPAEAETYLRGLAEASRHLLGAWHPPFRRQIDSRDAAIAALDDALGEESEA